ncbi:hypothetical protein KIH87_05775 [Paraneptunicella aestuarii]|uniref:hypothetical protein n=1 Tax=Paraneptunicella aestuarii TaxID=2831148 RepID=UPI001E446E32|nr:hypothetical protein [Paraneptunicella aestuarii]UAA39862.1 hypothetical protein KIH87_05775 [Paraneptunicella aestuarii]
MNIKNTFRALLHILLICPVYAFATQYTVEVNMVSSINNDVTLTETQAMYFPNLAVNHFTQIGATCDTGTNQKGVDGLTANEKNSLCPNSAGKASIVRVRGNADALVRVYRGAAIQEQGGFRYAATQIEQDYNLGSQGIQDLRTEGFISLIDKSLVTSGVLTFNYEVRIVAQ